MEAAILPFDTPKRRSLEKQANDLRMVLKDFERGFAKAHHGQKPSKDDIKADAAIAAKYKEYNRVREVMAGKLAWESLLAPPPKDARKHRQTDDTVTMTPRRQRHHHSPSKTNVHPNELDPYDPPSQSPKIHVRTIGPTPSREGTVLGIFDLLSASGSTRQSQQTPCSRKRKFDAFGLGENMAPLDEESALTPSQGRRKRSAALTGTQPATTPLTERISRQHSRTPVSEGKKLLLNHFFATPSAIRFAAVIDGSGDLHQSATRVKTPLRDSVLGFPSPNAPLADVAPDATPPYLKRSFSFKDKLLSASSSSGRNRPSMGKPGPRAPRHVTFAPKPLSQMIADLNANICPAEPAGPQDDDQDDMHALRELEFQETNILGHDDRDAAGPTSNTQALDINPLRIWKKKGQKRTTRRVMMRPTRMKPAEVPGFVADDDEDEEDDIDDLALDDEDPSSTRLDYAQSVQRSASHAERPAESIRDGQTQANNDDGNTLDRLGKANPPRRKVSKARPADEAKGRSTRSINPNAYTHMNFRSLKIKNKNSKAKGRARFGARRAR